MKKIVVVGAVLVAGLAMAAPSAVKNKWNSAKIHADRW